MRLKLTAAGIVHAVIYSPLPIRNTEINQFTVGNQSPIEQLIPKSSLQVHSVNVRQKAMDKIKLVVPKNPNRAAFSSNLFGQAQKIRGGADSDMVRELQKLAQPSYASVIQNALKSHNPEDLRKAVGFISSQNQHIIKTVSNNLAIPRDIIKSLYKDPLQLPGADAFQARIPQHRQLGEQPRRNNLELGAKPKMTDAELNALVNRPGDPANGKTEIISSIIDHKGLKRKTIEALQNPKNVKDANNLINQFHSGNANPGTFTKKIKGFHNMFELRSKHGTRVIFQNEGNAIRVFAILDKDNQTPGIV